MASGWFSRAVAYDGATDPANILTSSRKGGVLEVRVQGPAPPSTEQGPRPCPADLGACPIQCDSTARITDCFVVGFWVSLIRRMKICVSESTERGGWGGPSKGGLVGRRTIPSAVTLAPWLGLSRRTGMGAQFRWCDAVARALRLRGSRVRRFSASTGLAFRHRAR